MIKKETLDKYLQDERKGEIAYSDESIVLIDNAIHMINNERVVAQCERGIEIPGTEIHTIMGDSVQAFSTKLDDTYCIFVNLGVIGKQREYLAKLNFDFLPDGDCCKEEYIASMISFGWYFLVFHEYAHVVCGHTDAKLEECEYKKAQECEADIFALDYLIKWVAIGCQSVEELTKKIVQLYLSIYFILDRMGKENPDEYYNNKVLQNYYDPEHKSKRDHPLIAQRIEYLYEIMNVLDCTNIQHKMLPIHGIIRNRLKTMLNISDQKLQQTAEAWKNKIPIMDFSTKELVKSVQMIRKIIPRIGGGYEIEE